MKLLAFLCVLVTVVTAEKMRYDDHRVYTLVVTNKEQLDWLHQLESEEGYVFWNDIAMGHSVDLMVPPYKMLDFDEMSAKFRISRKLNIENVQS